MRCRVDRPRAFLNSWKRARRLEIEKNPNENRVREITDLGHYSRPNPLNLALFFDRPWRREARDKNRAACGGPK